MSASLQATMLAKLTPSDSEEATLHETVQALESACSAALDKLGRGGRATVQGSAAKGTWLAGSADLDTFLLLPVGTPTEDLEAITQAVADGTLEGVARKYAQHPYLIGTFRGMQVDLVPAYAVTEAGAKMSAVDRTPFHTAWVEANLDPHAKGQVRLLKQWCKGVGIYGAETSIAGFSGYLLEVLIGRFGTLDATLDWFAEGCPGPIALGENLVEDDVSPLIVVDPVDPARNCAAAVGRGALDQAALAAKAFATEPTSQFFFPNPPSAQTAQTLEAALAQQGATWWALEMHAQTDRLDIVTPQFQKAARAWISEAGRAGFPATRWELVVHEPRLFFQAVTPEHTLPATRPHAGPKASAEPNAAKFRKKWDGHADQASPIREEDGHLVLDLHIRARTFAAVMEDALLRVHAGKHVKSALQKHSTYDKPEGAADEWQASIADLVLDRQPWQR